MKAVVRRIGGISLAGRADSGHWVVMDGREEAGGAGGGSSPLELVLIGLGGCTAMDVLAILAKKPIKLDDLEVELEADRSEEHPKAFTAIRLLFHFYGENLRAQDLETAVELSEGKYCSVAAMLRKSAPIEFRIEVHPPRPAR
jgi:putative redox protein